MYSFQCCPTPFCWGSAKGQFAVRSALHTKNTAYYILEFIPYTSAMRDVPIPYINRQLCPAFRSTRSGFVPSFLLNSPCTQTSLQTSPHCLADLHVPFIHTKSHE